VGGLFEQRRPAGATAGSRWIALLSVGDAGKAAQYVRESGGQVLIAPKAIPGRGTHAVFRDPQGAVFGALATGGDPGDTPVDDGDFFWVDLVTTSPESAAGFYKGLVGYEVFPAEGSWGRDRAVLATEGIARAGIVKISSTKATPGWLPYVLVDDVATTLKHVRDSGGKVLVAPRPDLLGGNLAVIADPLGGAVGIVDWVRAGDKP
jgi:hypothetical protein